MAGFGMRNVGNPSAANYFRHGGSVVWNPAMTESRTAGHPAMYVVRGGRLPPKRRQAGRSGWPRNDNFLVFETTSNIPEP